MKNIIFLKHFVFLWSMVFVVGIATKVFAGGVDIPNTFTAGDTARASEVNENFSAVETAVDDNDSRITTNTSDISAKQERVTGTCAVGSSIRAINSDGTVICETDDDSNIWNSSGSDIYFDNGRVGIGTTSPYPSTKLHISSNLDESIWWTSALQISTPQENDVMRIGFTDDTNGYVTAQIESSRYIGTEGYGGYLVFKTRQGEGNIPERMRIDYSGNIGIGTTSPNYRVAIQASGNDNYLSMSEDEAGGADGFEFQIAPGSGTPTTRIGYLRGSFGNNNGFYIYNERNAPIRFGTNGFGNERMRITGDGNVGIGTTSPLYKLDVEGYVEAYGYYTGDIIFQKDGEKLWRMFEERDGLYLENIETGKTSKVFVEEDIVSLKEEIVKELREEIAELRALLHERQ